METGACASEFHLIARTSFLYRINATFQIAICILTVAFSFKALRVLYSHNVFNQSTRQLLFMSVIYADFHSFAYGFLQSWSMYRSIVYATDPCSIMFSGEECYILTWLTGVSKMSMIFIQVGLTTERLIDRLLTLAPKCKPFTHQGIFLNIIVILLSLATTIYSYSEGPTKINLTSCLLQGDIPLVRVLHTLVIYLVMSLVCLVFNFIMIRSLKSPKNKSFNLNVRITLREVKNSSIAVCVLSVSQFVTMTVYVSGSYIVFFLQNFISEIYFSNIILCIYTIPYAAVCLPISVILCIRWISSQRKIKIGVMTKTNQSETIEKRMAQLADAWEQTAIEMEDEKKKKTETKRGMNKIHPVIN